MLFEVITPEQALPDHVRQLGEEHGHGFMGKDGPARGGQGEEQAGLNGLGRDDDRVRITSYNVCYTKLLREWIAKNQEQWDGWLAAARAAAE